MHTFVLIHGAFYGGWVWRDVFRGLCEMGHAATAPTLTGIGERRHLANGMVDLSIHVEDVAAHIEMEDLLNVVLVGWSYGGMVSTGVLARIPHRIKSMIYLDSFVPEDGKSLFDYDSAVARGIMEANKKENKVIPPFPFDFLGVAEAGIGNFVKQRESPQPWRTMFEPVKALRNHQGIPIS